MNKYLEEFEKYKNCPLPMYNEIFLHPTQYRGDRIPIQFRVIEYKEDNGIVETVHSGRKVERTLHWIRKMYKKYQESNIRV